MVGSVRYMAPEQMMGERVDGRADVFSLAAVAYELLTGRAPFPGKTITEVVSRVVHGAHVPPRQADERLPEAPERVFARAFAPKAPPTATPAPWTSPATCTRPPKPVLDLEAVPGRRRVDADDACSSRAPATTVQGRLRDDPEGRRNRAAGRRACAAARAC